MHILVFTIKNTSIYTYRPKPCRTQQLYFDFASFLVSRWKRWFILCSFSPSPALDNGMRYESVILCEYYWNMCKDERREAKDFRTAFWLCLDKHLHQNWQIISHRSAFPVFQNRWVYNETLADSIEVSKVKRLYM